MAHSLSSELAPTNVVATSWRRRGHMLPHVSLSNLMPIRPVVFGASKTSSAQGRLVLKTFNLNEIKKNVSKTRFFFLGASVRALKTPVLNMTGDHSPHVEATVAFNGRLQPNKCTWMKIQVHIYQIFSILPSLNALVY